MTLAMAAAESAPRPPRAAVSLVIPVHNEAEGIDRLMEALLEEARALQDQFEIVFVNDGSTDTTLERLIAWQARESRVRIVDLSRNFGKEAALTAGLAHARGDCAISLDADLQDPPALIPQMLARWREGFEMVVAVHGQRASDSFMRRTTARGFYRLINLISDIRFIANAGDFRLLDRAALDAFLRLTERTRFNKGLFAWIGFRSCTIEHPRPLRSAGESRFTYRRLFRFAVDGITSFSSFPLRIWTYAGVLVASCAFVYGAFILARTLIYGRDVPGYASLLVATMFLGGINLLGIGMLGEYIGRIFIESKHRPLFVVRKVHENPRSATE